MLRELGDYGGATVSFVAAIRNDPGFAPAHLDLGIELLRSGTRLDDAISELRLAAELDVSLWEARQYEVDALRLKGDLTAALSVQSDLVDDVPDRPEVHCNMGNLLLSASRWEEAKGSFQRALALRPDYPLARAGLGIALWRSGSFAEGISILKETTSALPDKPLFRVELARALLADRRFEEAAAEAESLRALEPGNGLVYHVLAEIAVAQGRVEQARELANRALELGCPLAPDLREKIGMTKTDTGEGGSR